MSAVDTIRDIPVIVEHRKGCSPDYEPMIIDHDHDYSGSGFPFDNSSGRRTRDPLEDIAQRHPELAQHLQGFPRRSQRAGGAADHQDQQDDEFLRRRFERPFSGGRFERFGFPFDRDDFDREPQRFYEAYPEHFENFQNQHPQSPTHQQTQHQQQQTHPAQQQNFQQQHSSPQYSQQYHQQPQYNQQQQQQYQQPEYSQQQQQQAQQESHQQSQTQAPPLYQRRVSQGTQTEQEGEVAAAQQTDSGAEPEQKEEGGQTRGRPIQQSNTCDLGQSLPPDEAVNDREQRSMSLPPENKRFTSSVNIPMGGHQGQENGAGAGAKTQSSQGSSTGSTERVIPIHVEGRDDPILPKNFSTTSSQPTPPHPQPERIFTDSPRPQPERIFGQRPEHFTQFVNRDRDPHTRFPSDWHHSFERDFPEDDFGGFRRAGSPSRFGGNRTTSPQQQQPPQYHQKQETATQSPPKPQEQKPAQAEAAPQPQPKPQPQKQPLGPIEQIQAIQKDVSNLIGQVEVFNGQPRDKNYLYLDEMLTRNLLKLDNVDTQGQDAIRQARKEAIKCIEKTISHLEAKAAANAAQKMDVEQPQNEKMDAETSQEGMEVSPASSQQSKGEKEGTPTPQEATQKGEGIQQSKSGENVGKAQEAVQTNSEVTESQKQEGEAATEVKNSEDSTQKEAECGDAKDEKKDKKKTKKKSKEDKEMKQ